MIKAIIHRAQIAFFHIKKGDYNLIIKIIKTRFYSNSLAYGLEKIVDYSIVNELSENELTIRLFKTKDINVLKENMRHFRLVKENIPTCYIAENKLGEPVFRQWLFKQSQNKHIKKYFGSKFPQLNDNEALLEGGFTHPDHRGKYIMAKGILKILNLEEQKDIKRYITFVGEENIASLKGIKRAGFKPYILRNVKFRFFIRFVRYEPLTKKSLKTYKKKLKSIY